MNPGDTRAPSVDYLTKEVGPVTLVMALSNPGEEPMEMDVGLLGAAIDRLIVVVATKGAAAIGHLEYVYDEKWGCVASFQVARGLERGAWVTDASLPAKDFPTAQVIESLTTLKTTLQNPPESTT